MMKKLLAMILAVIMVLGVCMVPVAAQNPDSGVTLPEAFYVYSGEAGVVSVPNAPTLTGWTVCQTVNIGATTGKVGIAQTSIDGEYWDTGVIFDIETGVISSQLGGQVSVTENKTAVSGQTFFVVTFDGTNELVYINGKLVATISGFDANFVADYLDVSYICADACYDSGSQSFVAAEGVVTQSMSVFPTVFSAEQVALAYQEADINLSNYAAVTSEENKWYNIDCSDSQNAKTHVIDMSTIGANIAFPETGYTKVTTFYIPEANYAKGSYIGIAQIRGSLAKGFYSGVAYDISNGNVIIPLEYRGGYHWWTITYKNPDATAVYGNVQFIETLDADGNLNVYVNGVLAMSAVATDIVEVDEVTGEESHDSIMRFVRGDANAVMVLGSYHDGNSNYDVYYSLEENGFYSSWDASYPVNSFTQYGVSVISAQGYKLVATEGAIADFYDGGNGVDTIKSESNLSDLAPWFEEEYFNLTNYEDNPVVGLTGVTEYTYNNDGISLENGYTKVAIFYLPDNSDGSIKPNQGWITVFGDNDPKSTFDGGEPVDGIRYDIGSGKVLSACTSNFYRAGQTSFPVKASGFTVFVMTYDGQTEKVWINGQLAYYANESDPVPENSSARQYFAKAGLGKGSQGIQIDRHPSAFRNIYGYENKDNIYDRFGVMLSYDAGYTGVATDAAVAELSLKAGAIAQTLESTHVHTWSSWEIVVAPTCTETGTESRTCQTCGTVENRVVKANGHTWGAWTIISMPTAEANGSKERECEVCHEKQLVEIEPLVSMVDFDGIFGKAPYFSFDFSAEGGLTDIYSGWGSTERQEFTNQVKVSVMKVPNRHYAEGSLIGVAPVSDGGRAAFDIGVNYDLGTGLIIPCGSYNIVTYQQAVPATGTIEFIEEITASTMKVYVNGILALEATADDDTYATYRTGGMYRYLELNYAGDKTSNVYTLYGVKTLYGAAYLDVELTDTLVATLYKASFPATEQIISTTLPAYKNITGVANWKTSCNYLSTNGTQYLVKDMYKVAITSQIAKITVLYIPDVEYKDTDVVGISLLSDGDLASFDWSVKYNLATGEVSPAKDKDVHLTSLYSKNIRAVGYVQFVEVFTNTGALDVYVNGQLAYSANVSDSSFQHMDYFLGGTYRHLVLNSTDGTTDAYEACNQVKTMYFVGAVNPTGDMNEKVSDLYAMFLNSITRMDPPEIPDEPVGCEHANTEVRDAVAATCGKDGYTGDTYCKDCGEKIATGEVIPATGKHGATEIRGAVDATCTTDGYTGDTYCTDCGQKIATGEVIPAKGHSFENGSCTICGESSSGFVVIDGVTYYYQNGKVTKGWFVVNGKTYYASRTTGAVVNYDKKIGGKFYVWNEDTGLTIFTGFYETEGGTLCYLDGVQVIGWRHADGTGPVISGGVSEQYSTNPVGLYYFLSTTGYMVTDSTYKLGGYTREFNEDHTVKAINGLQMKTGILYYYVGGERQRGWYTDEATGNKYYFQGGSSAVYGQAAGKWMYIDNKVYYFYSGVSNPAYALKTSGAIGGIDYEYAEDGHILYTGFVNCEYSNQYNNNTAAYIQKKNSTTRYYVNGEMQTGWQLIDGNWYYFYAIGSSNGSGYMCCESRTIGGVWYEFTSDGICTNK